MAEFFAELKRRQMFRVAAAYAVVAWLLLQVVNNVAPVLDLPPWVARAFLLLLVIGFPIALLFVWMHELAPTDGAAAQAKTNRLDWILAGGIAAVIAIFLYQQLALAPGTNTAQQESVAPTSSPSQTAAGISIAVLPFANVSGDAEQEFFSDGMTDEIIAALAKVPSLRMVGRSSAFQFKGQNRDLRAIGQSLGATYLIDGSVRRAGARVRITAQLVKADDGIGLWTDNYDRELTDVFAIQEEIAQAIAASLRVPLGLQQGQTLVRARTKDQASYEDYLRAKAQVRARGTAGDASRGRVQLAEAARLLETVVAREPDFAPALALLSYTYVLMPVFEPAFLSGASEQVRPMVETLLPKAEAAARRAIELDSNNADGYIALASVEAARGRFPVANDLFTQGLALDPGNSDGLHHYSGTLADLGYLQQAVAMRKRLQALEPLVPIFRAVAGRILLASGQPDEALAAVEPGGLQVTAAHVYALQGRYGEAADALLSLPTETYLPGTLEAAARLLRAAPSPTPSPQALLRLGFLEFVYAHIGAPDRVLDWHESNLAVGYVGGAMNAILWGPSFAGIRKTERFKTFVRNSGFVDYWRERGWPDLCRPVGADDFECE